MSASPSIFIYGEAELSAALGLPVHLLQKNRLKKMTSGADWDLSGNRVAYSAGGVGAAVRLLHGLILDQKNAEPNLPVLLEKCRLRLSGDLPEVDGTVSRFWSNPRLVDFELADKSIVRVRVQSTKHLRAGMVLKLVRSPEGDYELAGRLPRSVREGRHHARGT